MTRHVGWFKIFVFTSCAYIPLAIELEIPHPTIMKDLMLFFFAGALGISSFFNSQRLRIPKIFLLAPAFLLVQIIVSARSPNLGGSIHAIALTASAISIGIFWLSADSYREVISPAAGVSALVISLFSLLFIFFRVNIFGGVDPLGSTFGIRNQVSIFLLQCLPLLALPRSEKKTQPSTALTVVAVGISFIVVANRTRAAWLVLAMELAYFLYLGIQGPPPWKRAGQKLGIAVIVGVFLLVVLPTQLKWNENQPYLTSLKSISDVDSFHRLKLWSVGSRLLVQHPLTGVGAGRFSAAFWEELRKTGEDASQLTFKNGFRACNDYLENAVETGIVGGILFLIIGFVWPITVFWKTRPGGLTPSLPANLLALSALASGIGAFFNFYFFKSPNLLFFSMTLAAAESTRKRRSPKKSLSEKSVKRFLLPLCVATLTLFFVEAIAWTSRDLALKYHKPHLLYTASNIWPYDDRMVVNQMDLFQEGATREELLKFLTREKNFRNGTPFSDFTQAIFERKFGSPSNAVAAYGRAIIPLNGGACYRPAYRSYEHWLQEGFLQAATPLDPNSLADCLKPDR